MAKSNKTSEFPKFIFYLMLLAFYSYSEFVDSSKKANSPQKPRTTSIQKNYGSSLNNAAAEDNVQYIKNLLERGVDVNKRSGKKQFSPLHVAALEGNVASVNYLLEHGANVNSRDYYQRTPLFLALENRQQAVVERILKESPILNISDKHGYSTLHYAAKGNYVEVMKKTLQSGVKINQTGVGGYSPLHYAARSGSKEAVIFLKENGADVNQTMSYGWTAGDLAFNKFPWIANYLGTKQTTTRRRFSPAESPFQDEASFLPPLHRKIVQQTLEPIGDMLQDPNEINQLDNLGRNALSFLIAKKLFHHFDEVLESNIDINNLDKSSQTPLLRLLSNRSHELKAIKLLNKGADCNQPNFMGDTPLHLAIRNRLFKAAALMLQKGANIFAKNSKDEKIIDEAIKVGNIAIIEALLKNGVNVLEPNIRGDTPLHVAIKAGNDEIAFLLLKNGADPSIKNYQGHSAIYLGKISRNPRLKELLSNRIEIEGINPAENPPAEAILPGRL